MVTHKLGCHVLIVEVEAYGEDAPDGKQFRGGRLERLPFEFGVTPGPMGMP
jgi:hypothetical protein